MMLLNSWTTFSGLQVSGGHDTIVKMKIFVTISLLLISLPIQADENKALMVASNLGLVVDWAQTREIAVNNDYLEENPILGKRPSIGRVNTYFVCALALNNIIGRTLPDPWAKFWYSSVFMIQVTTIRNNVGLGIKMRFSEEMIFKVQPVRLKNLMASSIIEMRP